MKTVHTIARFSEGWRTPQTYVPITGLPADWSLRTTPNKLAWIETEHGERPLEVFEVTKAISVRQPWAWALLHAGKDVENRTRRIAPPGWYYLHASGSHTSITDYEGGAYTLNRMTGITAPHFNNIGKDHGPIPMGGVIGFIHISGWTEHSDSKWFVGPKAAEIDRSLLLPNGVRIIPCKGALGCFTPSFCI